MPVPTAQEVLMWQLVNRARLDPVAEAARYGIDLNEGLAAGTIAEEVDRPAIGGEGRVEVVLGGVEADGTRFAPAGALAAALPDVPPARAAGTADRAPQHARAVGAPGDAHLGGGLGHRSQVDLLGGAVETERRNRAACQEQRETE